MCCAISASDRHARQSDDGKLMSAPTCAGIAAVAAGGVANDGDETSGVGRKGTTSRLTSELP